MRRTLTIYPTFMIFRRYSAGGSVTFAYRIELMPNHIVNMDGWRECELCYAD